MPAKVEDEAEWYKEQKPDWDRSEDILAGTKRLRIKSGIYLPRFEMEGEESYAARVQAATLTNFYSEGLSTSLGLMFREQPKLENSEIPEDELEDIDNLGHSVNEFAYIVASALLRNGLHHVQVEMPVNPGALSAGDDKRMGLRPYWVSIEAPLLFNAFYTAKNNVRTLTQTRVSGDRLIVAGFEATCEKTILVINRTSDPDGNLASTVTYETWAKTNESAGYQKSIKPGDSGEYGSQMDEIPLVTAQLDDRKFMVSRATLDEMSHKNIEHFQVASDHRNIFTATCYPIQFQIGTDEVVTEVGPHTILHSPGRKDTEDQKRQDVEFGYIAPESGPIEQGRLEKDQIMLEANGLMAKMQQRSGGDRTATGDTYDFTIAASPLQQVANAVENAINRCLQLHVKWKGLDAKKAGRFKMPPVPALNASEQVAITEIGTARRYGDLSYPTYIEELKVRGLLKTAVDPKKERELLDKEGVDLFKASETAIPAQGGVNG